MTCLHNPSKFPFLEFPKKAILLPQKKENFTIFTQLHNPSKFPFQEPPKQAIFFPRKK